MAEGAITTTTAAKAFYGRDWVVTKIVQLLDNRTVDKVQAANISGVLIVGETGAGKTCLCHQLVRLMDSRVLASHFIQAYRSETQSVPAFITRIVAQLSAAPELDAYASKLRTDAELVEWLDPHSDRLEREPDEAFQRLVLFPLLEMDTPDRNFLLIVDSLDEPSSSSCQTATAAATDSSQSIAELLANHHHLLPPWLLLCLSLKRSNKPLARLFTGFKKIGIDQVRRAAVVRDVQQYILSRLEREAALRRHLSRETAPALNLLHIKSNGCLLYVEAVLDGVADGSVRLRDIAEIPGTLNGLYLWLCQRLFTRRGWTKVQPLLAAILAARRPPSQDDLFRAAQTMDARMSRNEFKRRMHSLRKLIAIEEQGWTVFHSSFGEWLCDVKHCTQRFLVRLADGHARWAVTLTSLGVDYMGRQEVDDLAFHLGRMTLQPPLESWHLPLWLLWTKTPDVPDQQAVLNQVMVTSMMGLDRQMMDDSPVQEEEEQIITIEPSKEEELNSVLHDFEGQAMVDLSMVHRDQSSPVKVIDSQVFDEPTAESEILNKSEEADVEEKSGDPVMMEVPVSVDSGGTQSPIEDNNRPCSLVLTTSLTSCAADDEEEEVALVPSATTSAVERRNSIRYTIRPREHSLNETDDPEQSLFYAAQMGYNSAVTKLCQRYKSAISAAALRHALSISSRLGHANLVSTLLEAGADADAADSEGWTPLRASAWGGHVSVVEVLLSRGAQVDASDAEGRTALRAAAWAGHQEVVRSLLNRGAKVDGQDLQARTPLIAAAYMGHADIVMALLDAGAKPDHVDCEGRTALSVAVLSVACKTDAPARRNRRRRTPRLSKRRPSQNAESVDAEPTEIPPGGGGTLTGTLDGEDNEAVETVTILLEHGADVNHADKEGMTPLLVAAFEGHRTVCELLLEAEADVDQADVGGRTPILAAASMGHGHIVELLLFWGCYVDSIDAEGRTVLSVAAAQGSVEVVRRLLDRGLDEAHRDNAGWTPLHYAAFEGHPIVSDLLLEVGARPDAIDNDGRAPLLLAAQEGHLDVVERLLRAGADVDHKSLDGKTALRSAALEGHGLVVKELIRAGADPLSCDPDGRSTLYMLAVDNKTANAELLLREAGQKLITSDPGDPEGRSPLHIAAWLGHSAMVELLLAHGAQVNAVDREQRTPLQSAAWQGHETIVWHLLRAGARADQPCSQGATPLSIAAQEGHEGVARLLLAGGADPNRADGCGRTALKLAMKGGHKKVISLLENWTTCSNRSEAVNGSSRYLAAINGDTGSNSKKDYSPASTFETASAKSSSNVSGSTARSSSHVRPPREVNNGQQMSFTQQLQQQAADQRGSRSVNKAAIGLHLPLSSSRVLSPLSEPHSPLYSSPPPPTPPPMPAIWQPLQQLQSSPTVNGQHSSSRFSLLRRQRSDDAFSRSSVGGSSTPPSSRMYQHHRTSTCLEPEVKIQPQSSHMQIILGPPSKSRRNGFGQQKISTASHHPPQSSSHSSGGGAFSGMLAGIRNSAFLHGGTKLKNALCNAVSRPSTIGVVIKKETQL